MFLSSEFIIRVFSSEFDQDQAKNSLNLKHGTSGIMCEDVNHPVACQTVSAFCFLGVEAADLSQGWCSTTLRL